MCVLLAQAAPHRHVIVDAASRHVDSTEGLRGVPYGPERSLYGGNNVAGRALISHLVDSVVKDLLITCDATKIHYYLLYLLSKSVHVVECHELSVTHFSQLLHKAKIVWCMFHY